MYTVRCCDCRLCRPRFFRTGSRTARHGAWRFRAAPHGVIWPRRRRFHTGI